MNTSAIEVFSQNLSFPLEKELIVTVSVHENIWTAECDALGLVTEAQSYDELIHRALEIAPELAKLNAINHYKLQFVQ